MSLAKYNQAVHDHSNKICRFADKLLVNKSAAKDITQEAFLRLWEKRESVDFNKVRAWLFTTTYHLCIDYLKKNKRFVYDAIPEKTTELANPDLKEIVNEALLLLSEVQRSILLLKDYEGYNYAEIGELLSLNESQVKVYLFRARKRIKEHIGDLKLVI